MRVYKAAALLIDAEHTRCVATQKGGFGVSVEPEIVEPPQAPWPQLSWDSWSRT